MRCFNPDAESPLLTPEEDANDFQLTDETAEEAKAREAKAKRDEQKAQKAAEKRGRDNAPDLPFGEENTPQKPVVKENLTTVEESSAVETEKANSELFPREGDIYADIRNHYESSPIRVKAFLALPDGEHELGGIKFTKDGEVFYRDGQKLSAKGIEKSFWGVDISQKENTAAESGKDGKIENVGKVENVGKDGTETPKAKIEDFGEKIEGGNVVLYSLQQKPKYAIDSESREAAKSKIKELWNSDELKSGKDIDIPLGRFSPHVVKILQDKFALKKINENSRLNLKLTELRHIKSGHENLTADEVAELVDVFDNPDWLG